MKLPILLLLIALLMMCSRLCAQTDSLAHYSLVQLDSILKTQKTLKGQLPYTLAILQKAEKELDTKDTAYAKLLTRQGNICQQLRDFPNATTYLQQAIEIWQTKKPKHAFHAQCLNTLGLVHVNQGQYPMGEKLWLEALNLRKEILGEKHPDYAASVYNLGNLYSMMGDHIKSEEFALQAFNIRKEVLGEKHADYAASLNNLGNVYWSMSDYAKAEKFYLEATKIRKEIFGENHSLYAASLINLGNLYKKIEDYTKAQPFYLKALEIQKKVLGEKHSDYSTGLINLGTLYDDMGNYAKAEAVYLQALNINEEILGEKHPLCAASLDNLGIIYTKIGDYNKAEAVYLKSMNIQKELLGEKHPIYAGFLTNLGVLYQMLGNYSKSEFFYLQGLNILQEIFGEKSLNCVSVLNNLGSFYKQMQDYVKSETFYLKALAIHQEADDENQLGYASCLSNLGLLYKEMGDLAKAEIFIIQALDIRKEIEGEKHPEYALGRNNLGVVYMDMNNYTKAEALCLEALNTQKEVVGKNHPDYAKSLGNLGNLYEKMSNYAQAQFYFSELLPLRLDLLEQQGATLGEKAKQDLFKTVLPYINNVNAFGAFHCTHDSLLALIQDGLLLTKGYALAGVTEVLPLIKSIKDSSLNASYDGWVLAKHKLGQAYNMTPTERKEKGINIDSLERLAIDQEAALMKSSMVLKERLGYNKKRFYYKDLVKNVSKNDVAIDFVRFELNKDTVWYYAMVTQTGWKAPKYIPLCTEKQLEPYTISEIHPEKESYITKANWSKDLYNLVIKPLEPYVKNKKNIHWAPVGLLNQVAMGTLQNPKNKLFLEKFEIHQYGALKDFIIKKQQDGSFGAVNKNVLLVGDIAFDLEEVEHINIAENSKDIELYASRSIASDSTRGSSRFVRLPGTKIELENLNKAFVSNKWTIQQLQQKDALEERVRGYSGDKTPSVLHFATHGFFIPAKKEGVDNPLLRSGIALAGANRVWMGKPQLEGVEDGLWTAYEIANTNLMNANLVVLSACETAKGQIDPHEGVVGLQRSFKIAGVDNMLLSLWQVPDKETVELMEEFYKHYLEGATPSVALRKAQGVMSKKYPAPYYWAAFVLIE